MDVSVNKKNEKCSFQNYKLKNISDSVNIILRFLYFKQKNIFFQ